MSARPSRAGLRRCHVEGLIALVKAEGSASPSLSTGMICQSSVVLHSLAVEGDECIPGRIDLPVVGDDPSAPFGYGLAVEDPLFGLLQGDADEADEAEEQLRRILAAIADTDRDS